METTSIRTADTTTASDAKAIADIYNHYVATSTATFETDPVDHREIRTRIDKVFADGLPWLVAEADGEIPGYAYAAPWKPRQAYAHTVETTVYVSPTSLGRGTGKQLMHALLDELIDRGVHCALAGISLPNDASIRLHESLRFVHSGTLAEVGWKSDRWIDVGYWQRILGAPSAADSKAT